MNFKTDNNQIYILKFSLSYLQIPLSTFEKLVFRSDESALMTAVSSD